jgi:hypothetical protein
VISYGPASDSPSPNVSETIPRPRPFNRTPPNHGIISLSAYADLHACGQMNEPSGYGVRLQAGSTEMHSPVRNTKVRIMVAVVVGDAQGRGIGGSRSCTVPGKAESWTLGTNRLQLQQTCRGCRVKRRDQRTESQRDGQNLKRFSTRGEVSRAYLGCGARGTPPAERGWSNAPSEAWRDMRWCRTEIHQWLPVLWNEVCYE